VVIPPDGGAQTSIGTGLANPYGVAVDAAGNVFIADTNNDRVVEVPADGGAQTTVGIGLANPYGVAVDASGNVFIADTNNSRVVKVPAGGGAQTTVGTGLSAPFGVAVDAAGNLFVADPNNSRVVEVPVGGGAQTTVGTGLSGPYGVAVDAVGNVFIADAYASQIVKVPAGGGAQTTVGTGVSGPYGVAVDGAGNVFISNSNVGQVLKVPADGGAQTVVTNTISFPFQLAVMGGPLTQQISFTSTRPSRAIPGDSYLVSASGGGSGNPVTYTIGSGQCSLADHGDSTATVTFGLVGKCIIQADQAGNGSYAAAPAMRQTVFVRFSQEITYTSTRPTRATPGSSYLVSATGGSSGNPVTYTVNAGACTVVDHGDSTATVSFTTVGTCMIRADQAGTGSYVPAIPARQTVYVRNAQEITFTSTPPVHPVPGNSYLVTATGGGSGNPVTYTVNTGTCTIIDHGNSTGTVSFTAAGRCLVYAHQAASATYFPAPQKWQSIMVYTP
jgi:sugar lactone lactonase YvrE